MADEWEANDGFNGSSATFDGVGLGAGVLDMDYDEGGADVDVSNAEEQSKKYVPGQKDPKTTITVIGSVSCSKGDHGALVLAWNDGGSDGSIADALVSSVKKSGAKDGEIKSVVVFVPFGGTAAP